MSLRLQHSALGSASHSQTQVSSDEEDDNVEENWDDWVSDSGVLSTVSLFDSKTFPTALAAINHDHESHGFHVEECCRKLGPFDRKILPV